MRVTTYNLSLDQESLHPCLVKEQAVNYSTASKLDCPDVVTSVMRDVFGIHKKAEEYVYMVAVNTAGTPVGFFEIAHGDINFCQLTPAAILTRMLLTGASGCILVHNHPSGSMTPSSADIQFTEAMRQSCKTMGRQLLDHIIVPAGEYIRYFSFKENGMLDNADIG